MWYCNHKQMVVGRQKKQVAVSSFDDGRSSPVPTTVESRHWRGTAPSCQVMTSSIYLINHSTSAAAYSVDKAVPWRGM